MKFSLFAHMERLNDTPSFEQLYHDFINHCIMADEGGMSAVWTGEHHGMNFTISPNPFLNIVDLAARTKHVRLGTGTLVAPFWHPIKLAEEAAMTDIITGGRLDIGIARGAYNFEYERLMPGLDAWEAGQRLREIIPAVQKLWQGDYFHEGTFHKFPITTCSPKPIQQPGPPIWIAARDPNSHEFAVTNGCNVQVTPLWQGIDEVKTLMQRYRDACSNHSNLPKPKIMLLQHVYVGTDDDDIADAAKQLSHFYCYFGAWFKNNRSTSQAMIEPLSDDDLSVDMYSPQVIVNNLVVGTASTVIDRLKLYQDLGFDEFSYWLDSGMTSERKQLSLTRFIDKVMPAFN